MKPILTILVLIMAAAVADAKTNSRVGSNASTKSGKGSYSVSTTSKAGKRSSSSSMSTSSKSGKRSKCTSSSKTGKDGSYSMSYPPVVVGGGGGKRAKKIKKLLSNVSGATAIDTAGSCQEYAFKWVAFEDPISPPLQPGADNVRIIQRYVLAVLYCSTNGAGWTTSTNWLTCANECDWQGVDSCNDENAVTYLSLGRGNNLIGSIPKELAALSSLEILSLSRSPGITGPIPKELGNVNLSRLKFLSLYDNGLTGPIPKELANLSSLERLLLYGNDFTVPIPNEVCAMRNNADPPGSLYMFMTNCNLCFESKPNDCCSACF